MTVEELIKELSQYPKDTKVYLWAGNWLSEHEGEVASVRYRDDMYDKSFDKRVKGIYLSHVK